MEKDCKSFLDCAKKTQTIAIIFLSVSLSLFSVPEVFGAGDVTWGTFDSPKFGWSIENGNADPGQQNDIIFEIMDDALIGGGLDEVTVQITSNLDPDGITLTLSNEDKNGVIQNNKIVLMRDESLYQITDTAILSIADVCFFKFICSEDEIDTIDGNDYGLNAYSDTSTNLRTVPIHFIETGEDTQIFQGKLKFTSDTSVLFEFPGVSRLNVSLGDTITFEGFENRRTNGIILPITEDKGGIVVEDGGTLTITYVSQDDAIHSHTADVDDPNDGGSGGGGPIRGGLVIDSPTGGCSGDCQPPTLGLDKNYKRIVSDGFSYNGNPVDVDRFYTPYPLITVNVGEENISILKIYDDEGADNIAHVGLAFGLGKNEYFSQSRATIEWDRTIFLAEQVSVYDPENVLDNVKVVSEEGLCSESSTAHCLILTFYHTFREPLDFNMVGTLVWDHSRNSWQNFYNHGIEIVGDSLNPPDEHIGIDRGNLVTLFETGKNISVDIDGNQWTLDREWKKDIIFQGKIDDEITSLGYDRNHVRFETYKKGQELIALYKLDEILDGKSIQNDEQIPIKTFYGKFLKRSEDITLQNSIEYEKHRAEKLFSMLFENIQHNFKN